jgi:acyl-CoA dehydrogenase
MLKKIKFEGQNMIDFSLTDEVVAILDTVKAFRLKVLMPYENILLQRAISGTDPSPTLTWEEQTALQQKGREIGLWGINTPEEFGGMPLSPLLQSMINMELGKTFVPYRVGGNAPSILFFANEEQKQEYTIPNVEGQRNGNAIAISEPSGGSDVSAMRTTAIRDGDDFIINGEKMWISNGSEVDFLVVFARTPREGDENGITGFIVDRAMGWTSSDIPLMGSEKVALLNFNDVRVPARNVIGEVNGGFKLLIDWVYENRLVLLAPRNIGACERLLEMAIDWANTRKTFGKFLRERENIAFWVAESDIEIRAAKLLTFNGAWKMSAGMDYRHEAYVAKVYAARIANQVVDRVLQIHGGMGYAMEMPIQRWYRDLRVERIYEGSDEMNLVGIARNLFKGNTQPGQVN